MAACRSGLMKKFKAMSLNESYNDGKPSAKNWVARKIPRMCNSRDSLQGGAKKLGQERSWI